jgi:hypothetical protein
MTTLLMAALLVNGADPADPVVKLPTGSAPTMMVLQAKDKMLVRESTLKQLERVPVTEKVTVAGKEVERTVYKTIEKERKFSTTYPIDGTTFQTANGKKLEKEEALKKLATPTLVVVSSDGKPVDEGFLAALRPGTLVVVMPTMATGPVAPGVGVRPLPILRPAIKVVPAPAPVPPPAPPAVGVKEKAKDK